MNINRAMEYALEGKSILFVGAGFSKGAKNAEGKELPDGKGLMRILAAKTELPNDIRLDVVVEQYIEKFGSLTLANFIQDRYSVETFETFHQNILSIPWKRVYTTNFDNLIETVAKRKKIPIKSVSRESRIHYRPASGILCVHLNGHIQDVHDEELSGIILSESSYVSSSIEDSEWVALLRQDIVNASSVFFIGFSMASDLDIKRILASYADLPEKSFFFVGINPSVEDEIVIPKYGTMYKERSDEFSDRMMFIQKDWIQPTSNEFLPLSISEYLPPSESVKLTDKDFIDLLLYGRRSSELLAESNRKRQSYILQREAIDNIFENVTKGRHVIVVSSEMGNGKTLLIENIHYLAVQKGFRVFSVTSKGETLQDELEELSKITGKILLTIENYHLWMKEIRHFCYNNKEDISLILSARNTHNDNYFDELKSSIGTFILQEYHIDKLKHDEIEWFVEAFNQYGLWQYLAGSADRQKEMYISSSCSGQIHSLLLKLLESPDISNRITAFVDAIKRTRGYYQQLLSVFILLRIGYEPDLGILTEIWGPELISSSKFRNDDRIRELIDFRSNNIRVRSSAVAEHVLSSISDPEIVTSTLIKMFERIAVVSSANSSYYHVLVSLMQSRNICRILPERNKRACVIHYYESIKNNWKCRKNHHFWLQYAIACLDIEDIDRAGGYFSTATSIAKKKDAQTYHIENHYARYLIEKTSTIKDISSAMSNIREAQKIIERQMGDKERLYYPYRVASGLSNFVVRFQNSLSHKDIANLYDFAQRVLSRISDLSFDMSEKKDVQECSTSMNLVLAILQKKEQN